MPLDDINKSENTEDPVTAFIKTTIENNDVVIFSKSACPFCDQAKNLFRKIDQNYFTVELDERDDGRLIQQKLGRMTGVKTVPRVFIKGKSVGGASELESIHNSGRLKKMLA